MPRFSVSQLPIIPQREAEICQRFRQLRVELGIQQKDAARRIGIPLDTLRTYEYARVALRFQVAWRFCKIFDANLAWIATGEGGKKRHFQVSERQWKLFTVSSDLARFIPSGELLSTAYDSLIKTIPQTFTTHAVFKGFAERAQPIGISKERVDRNARDSRISHLQARIRHLPSDLVEEFAQCLDRAVEEFLSKHGSRLEAIRRDRIDRGERLKDIGVETAEALAENAIKVGRALGIGCEDVLQANDVFPSELLDSEYEPSRELLVKSIEQAFSSVESASMEHGKKRDNILTHVDEVTYGEARNEHPSTSSMQTTEIAQRIKAAREKLGLSQSEAADQWKLRLQTLQQWEHGRREPRGVYRERLEKILAGIESGKHK